MLKISFWLKEKKSASIINKRPLVIQVNLEIKIKKVFINVKRKDVKLVKDVKLMLNECPLSLCSNNILWEIRSNITCGSFNVIYLRCNIWNTKSYIEKIVRDFYVRFKFRL